MSDSDPERGWLGFDEQVGRETPCCRTKIRPGGEHRLRLSVLPSGSRIVDIATGGAHLGS